MTNTSTIAKAVRREAAQRGGRFAMCRSDYDSLRSAGIAVRADSLRFTELGVVEVISYRGLGEVVFDGTDVD